MRAATAPGRSNESHLAAFRHISRPVTKKALRCLVSRNDRDAGGDARGLQCIRRQHAAVRQQQRNATYACVVLAEQGLNAHRKRRVGKHAIGRGKTSNPRHLVQDERAVHPDEVERRSGERRRKCSDHGWGFAPKFRQKLRRNPQFPDRRSVFFATGKS